MCDFFAGEFHRHTSEGSKRDGYGLVEDGVKYAAQLGYAALAITDHGMMSGCAKHYLACKKYGIKYPMMGVEAYFQITFGEEKAYYHATLLAKNNVGYQNMCKMMTEAAAHQFRVQKGASASTRGIIPIVTLADYEKYHEGIILLSGCIGGMIPQLYVKGHEQMAENLLLTCYDIFQQDFYLEVMPNPTIEKGVNIQRQANEWLIKKGRQHGIKVVGTTDSHYIDPKDYASYLKMWEVSGAVPSTDYSRLYLHTGEQWAASWKDMMGFRGEHYLETTWEIAEKCNATLDFTDMKPKVDWNEPSRDRLLRLSVEGLESRGLWDWDGTDEGWHKSRYVREMMDEYQIVCETGFEDYFLTVQDFCAFMKRNKISYAARGSVNGFLLAYLLDISQVDSIKYGTYPFRFLRRDKKGVDPDIDLDVQRDRRSEVIDYVLEKYKGRSAPISNFQYWKTKALVNELIKTYPQMSKADSIAIKDALIAVDYDEKPVGYERIFEDETFGGFFREFEGRHKDFLLHFCNLHGQLTHYGKHAGGVMITNEEAWKYLSLFRVVKTVNSLEDGDYVLQTSFNMEDLSELRLMKYDILGLGEHQHIAEIEAMVGCTFNDEIIHDPRIYEWFREIRTEAIFQSGTRLAQEMYQNINVQNFIEVCVAISMNRPGPYSSGLFQDFMNGKAGNVNTSLPWYPFCAETYGAIVYQEHAMLIAVKLAGMSWPDADKFIKGISKKKIMPALEKQFIEGLQTVGGLTAQQAQDLFDGIKKYSFNKNHAVGYALIAVYGMWLKINYPYEFYCAALRKKDKSKKERKGLEQLEAAFLRDTTDAKNPMKGNGYILAPNVNSGAANYAIVERNGRRFLQQGLINIDGVGPKAAEDIAAHGPYTEPDADNLDVYIEAWQTEFKSKGVSGRTVTKKVITALYQEGALDTNEDRQLDRALDYRDELVSQHEWKWKKAKKQAEKNQETEMENKKKWESLRTA